MIDILLVHTIMVEHFLTTLVLMEKYLEKLLLYKDGGVIKVLNLTACCNEHENYPLDTYQSGYTLSAPGGVETISIDKGFLGFCVANGSYQILARTSTTIFVKTTYADENNAWFVLLGQE